MVIFVSRFVFSPDGSVPQNYVDFKLVWPKYFCSKIYLAMASSLKGANASQPISQDFSVHLLSDAGGGSLEEAHAIRQLPYLAAFIPPTPCVGPHFCQHQPQSAQTEALRWPALHLERISNCREGVADFNSR